MTAVSYNINEPEAARLLADKFNIDLPTAGQPLIDGVSVEGSGRIAYLNVAFSSAVSAVLTLTRTVGATTVSQELNAGAAIGANALYQATLVIVPGQTINLKYGDTGGKYHLTAGAVVQNG